jgi:uncharacterized membrane protein
MRSRAEAMGHAIHPMLISFPLGLLATAVVFDIIYLFTDRPGFTIAAAYAIAAGLVGGVVAAVFGLIDWLAVPAGTRARRVGALHGVANGVVLLLFSASWLLRVNATDWRPGALAIVLGVLAAVAAAVGGWLGGELVERLGLSVHERAGLDAPSSLTSSDQPPATSRGR